MKKPSLPGWWTSLFIPGMAQFLRGDPLRGGAFFLSTLGLSLFLLFSPGGLAALPGLLSLGTQIQTRNGFDVTPGDHSLHFLVDGILTLVVLGLWFALWVTAVKDARRPRKLFPGTLLLPAALLGLFFLLLPVVVTLAVGFTDYRSPDHLPPLTLLHWVGLENFQTLIHSVHWSGTLVQVLLWNIFWALSVTALSFFAGFWLSSRLNTPGLPFPRVWKGLFFLPYALPAYFSLLIFRAFFGPQGPLNLTLTALGLPSLPFFSDPTLARTVVIFINVWLTAPYFLLLISSVREGIPRDLYDAAALDGAGTFRQTWSLTLPLVWSRLKPGIFLSLIFQFNNFQGIYLVTEGNPSSTALSYAGQTDLLVSWIYKLTLHQGQYGLAAVLTLGLFLFLGLLATLALRGITAEEGQ